MQSFYPHILSKAFGGDSAAGALRDRERGRRGSDSQPTAVGAAVSPAAHPGVQQGLQHGVCEGLQRGAQRGVQRTRLEAAPSGRGAQARTAVQTPAARAPAPGPPAGPRLRVSAVPQVLPVALLPQAPPAHPLGRHRVHVQGLRLQDQKVQRVYHAPARPQLGQVVPQRRPRRSPTLAKRWAVSPALSHCEKTFFEQARLHSGASPRLLQALQRVRPTEADVQVPQVRSDAGLQGGLGEAPEHRSQPQEEFERNVLRELHEQVRLFVRDRLPAGDEVQAAHQARERPAPVQNATASGARSAPANDKVQDGSVKITRPMCSSTKRGY